MKTSPTCRMQVLVVTTCLLLSACTAANNASPTEAVDPARESASGLPNPASVFCQEQGGRLEIRTDTQGGQFGACIFPDGSECDEWAFYRGECFPAYPDESQPEGKTPQPKQDGSDAGIAAQEQHPAQPVIAWVGHISNTPAGAQYDDFVSLMPAGSGEIGISGMTPEVEAQLVALRDGAGVEEFPMFWGSLSCNVPDYGGCQLLVREVKFGQILVEPIAVDGWQGSVVCSHFNSTPSNVCRNAFALAGNFPVWYGLWSADPDILAQLENFRDSGQTVQIWGQLLAGVPDGNGTQIQVDRIDGIDG